MKDPILTAYILDIISEIKDFESKELISRPEWGDIKFDALDGTIQQLFTFIEPVNEDNLKYVSNDIGNIIKPILEKIHNAFILIDNLRLDSADINIRNFKEDTSNNILQNIDKLFIHLMPYVSYMKHQDFDLNGKLDSINEYSQKAIQLYKTSKTHSETVEKEGDKILEQIRLSSGEAGVAPFTEDFKNESNEQDKSAKKWLNASVFLFISSLMVLAFMYFCLETPISASNIQTISYLITKSIFIALLISATYWCSNIYKTLKHQAAINKHRALSLQTFQAFSNAASDQHTKDAVLMETTRSIFARASTGYINQNSESSDNVTTILESNRLNPLNKHPDPD